MLKIFSRLFSIGSLLIALSIISFAQNEISFAKEIQKLKLVYSKFDTSIKNKDIKFFEKHLDKNYELVRGEGKTSREEFIISHKEFFTGEDKITEALSKIEKIEVSDGKYSVQVSNVLKGFCKCFNDEVLPFEVLMKSTDLWTKEKGDLKLKTQIIHEVEFLLDGEKAFIN